jgi:hypothetical protein
MFGAHAAQNPTKAKLGPKPKLKLGIDFKSLNHYCDIKYR